MPEPLAHLVAGCRRPEHDLNTPHQRPHGGHVKIRHGAADVAQQPTEEPGAIFPLEGDFLIMDNDGVHFSKWRSGKVEKWKSKFEVRSTFHLLVYFSISPLLHLINASAAQCPLTTAPSIVAGNPVSIQSPARKRPGTPVSVPGRGG